MLTTSAKLPNPYSIPPATDLAVDHDAAAYVALGIALVDHIDEMPSGADGSRAEQRKEYLRARLDALLDNGDDLTEFADIVFDNADDPTALAAGADAMHDLYLLTYAGGTDGAR